jgi:urea carboxylase
MKMEITVQEPCDSVISHLLFDAGNRVDAGQALVILEPVTQGS